MYFGTPPHLSAGPSLTPSSQNTSSEHPFRFPPANTQPQLETSPRNGGPSSVDAPLSPRGTRTLQFAHLTSTSPPSTTSPLFSPRPYLDSMARARSRSRSVSSMAHSPLTTPPLAVSTSRTESPLPKDSLLESPAIDKLAQTKQRFSQALGIAGELTYEMLAASEDFLELSPIPGLQTAVKTLLKIWDAAKGMDVNSAKCLTLAERCASILSAIKEDVLGAGPVVALELDAPMTKLNDAFNDVLATIDKQVKRPFITRYLKRDEVACEIADCDLALTDALGMFGISVQMRILKHSQQVTELRHDLYHHPVAAMNHQYTHRKIASEGTTTGGAFVLNDSQWMDAGVNNHQQQLQMSGLGIPAAWPSHLVAAYRPNHPGHVRALSRTRVHHLGSEGISVSSPIYPSSPLASYSQLPSVSPRFPGARQSGGSQTVVLHDLKKLHSFQNSVDAQVDKESLNKFRFSVNQKKDVDILNAWGIERADIPEAIETLQRVLKRYEEDASASGPHQLGTLTTPRRPSEDIADKTFIKTGIDALRRLSSGSHTTLPSWTITKHEVDMENQIGYGLFADVFKGKWQGKTVAIKVLNRSTPRPLFIREVEVWKSLKHVNVLELYGASSAAGDPPWFFVSPYAKHGSLSDYLRALASEKKKRWKEERQGMGVGVGKGLRSRRQTSWGTPGGYFPVWQEEEDVEDADEREVTIMTGSAGGVWTGGADGRGHELVRFMQEIASGMEYLHFQDVLHGDLKAANVLVDDDLHCIISDFGQSEIKSEVYRISGAPTPIGTHRWKAPELLMGFNQLTAAVDVYAFAISCIEILTDGLVPWSLIDDGTVTHLVSEQDSRPMPPVNTNPTLVAILEMCWERDPTMRPGFSQILQSLDEVQFAFNQVVPHRTSSSISSTSHHSMQSHARKGSSSHIRRESQDTVIMPQSPFYYEDWDKGRVSIPEPLIFLNATPLGAALDSVNQAVHNPDRNRAESDATIFVPTMEIGKKKPSEDDEPLLAVKKRLMMTNEERYRAHLVHEFHPSLTLALWDPCPAVPLGAVGYLSKTTGEFTILFNAIHPDWKSASDPRKEVDLPSIHGYGVVSTKSKKQPGDTRNGLQRRLGVMLGAIYPGDGLSSSKSGKNRSFTLRHGQTLSFMHTGVTTYDYLDSLDAPKKWFKANVGSIMNIYGEDHDFKKNDLCLVIGTLAAEDYVLFVSHSHPDGRVQFTVTSSSKPGQPWGSITTETQRNAEVGWPCYDDDAGDSEDREDNKGGGSALADPFAPPYECKISTNGTSPRTLLLARLRFKSGGDDLTVS